MTASTRIEGGAVICRHCNAVLTFNFMARPAAPCACAKSRERGPCDHDFRVHARTVVQASQLWLGRTERVTVTIWLCTRCGEQGHPIPPDVIDEAATT